MNLLPVLYYLLPFLAGFGMIRMAYRIQRGRSFRFLTDYFSYITAAVTYGFFNWIGPFLVQNLAEDLGREAYYRVILIFGALAIPFLMVKIYFLLALVVHWWGGELTIPLKFGFWIYVLATISLFVLDILAFFVRGRIEPGGGAIFILGAASIAIQLGILAYPLLAGRARPATPMLRALRFFAAVNLVCYGLYTAAAYSRFITLTPLLYYAFLFPPLLVVREFIRRQGDSRSSRTAPETLASLYGLTEREREIVGLVLAGRSNRQIGKELFISLQTVKNRLTEIYRKVGVRGRSQLMSRLLRPNP